jgi:hypothetical protein
MNGSPVEPISLFSAAFDRQTALPENHLYPFEVFPANIRLMVSANPTGLET